MTKGLKILLIIGCCALFLTGCGDKKEASDNTSNTNVSDNSSSNQTKSTYTLEDLKNDLTSVDSNLEVQEKSASLVGATEGYGYIMSGCNVEVYKFDVNSDSYKTAEQNQELNLEAFGTKLKASVKNGYAYYVNEDENNCSYIEKLFE